MFDGHPDVKPHLSRCQQNLRAGTQNGAEEWGSGCNVGGYSIIYTHKNSQITWADVLPQVTRKVICPEMVLERSLLYLGGHVVASTLCVVQSDTQLLFFLPSKLHTQRFWFLEDTQGARFYDMHGTTLHLFVIYIVSVQYMRKRFASKLGDTTQKVALSFFHFV